MITETINPKEAILFMCGGIDIVSKQFTEMLKYCKKKNLRVVDMFFDTSNIKFAKAGCVISTHCGPKTTGILYIEK